MKGLLGQFGPPLGHRCVPVDLGLIPVSVVPSLVRRYQHVLLSVYLSPQVNLPSSAQLVIPVP